MNDAIKQVLEWQSHFGRKNGKIDHTVSAMPRAVSPETARARVDFVIEELDEYLEANRIGDLVGVLDALLDILYFTFGMIVIHGMQHIAAEGFDIVHRANMSKLWPGLWPGDRVKTTVSGKVIKPDTFEPPEPKLRGLFK